MKLGDIRLKYIILVQILQMMAAQILCLIILLYALRHHRDNTIDGATSSKTKKRARKVVENDVDMGQLVKSVDKMVAVFDNLSNSINELVKLSKNVAPEDMLWEQLMEIGVDPVVVPDVYMHFVYHPEDLKAFNGVPVQHRKEMLHHFVPGYPPGI